MLNVLFIFLHVFASSRAEKTELILGTKDTAINRSILYVFAGSDWCANCLRLEKKVLSNSTFISALDSCHVNIEIIDLPQRKKLSPETVKYNQSMSDKLGFNGDFPTLFIYSLKNNKYTSILYRNDDPSEFSIKVFYELNKLNE